MAATAAAAAASPSSFSTDELLGKSVAAHYVSEERRTLVRGIAVTSWRWRSVDADASKTRPCIVGIHGGPAFAHHYILPLILLCDTGFDVVLYDQAGCGASAADETQFPWLLTLEYYPLEELPAVLQEWGLDSYFLYGSSWGTIVCQVFALTQPSGLRGMILDGALSDAQLYIRTQWRDNLSKLPLLTQQKLKRLEAAGEFGSAEYKCIEAALTGQFTHRLLPPAQCYLDSVAAANLSIYAQMQGPSEFAIGGVLAGMNLTEQLHRVRCPTLVMMGEFDTMTRECSMALVDNIPGCKPLAVIARAGHCKLADEPQQCFEIMSSFLAEAATRA